MTICRTTEVWRGLLEEVLEKGSEVSQVSLGADWKGRANRELIGLKASISMSQPVILCPGRFPGGKGYRFMCAEAAWVLSGDNRLSTILPYAAAMRGLSDDGRTLSGAYGPPFIDQVPYIVKAFQNDVWSRQAVMTIWRPRPQLGGADVPCTVALQWLIRPDPVAPWPTRKLLHCVVTMRSSDLWTGLVFDWFTFTAMSAFVALALRPHGIDVQLGELTVTAGSQHVYLVDRETALACASRSPNDLLLGGPVEPLDLADLESCDDLVEHLWSIARRTGLHHGPWLRELERI